MEANTETDVLICDVQLAGDMRNTVHRGVDNPVTYPELLVLKNLHGPENVLNARVVATIERTEESERKRLELIYGAAKIAELFPGAMAPLPLKSRSVVDIERGPRGIKKNSPKSLAVAKETAKAMAEAALGRKDEADVLVEDEDDAPAETAPTAAPAPVSAVTSVPRKGRKPTDDVPPLAPQPSLADALAGRDTL